MIKTVTTTLTVFGFEIGKVNVETELSVHSVGKERMAGGPRKTASLPLDEQDVAQILAETVKKTGALISDKISFADGYELVIDGNGDPYTACQNLKRVLKTELNVMTAIVGVAKVAGIYSPEDVGPAGLFNRNLAEVIHSNWETIEMANR